MQGAKVAGAACACGRPLHPDSRVHPVATATADPAADDPAAFLKGETPIMARKRRNPPAGRPSYTELFTPKLVTVLREGYRLADLRADIAAGLTVAIVALPLSMAIAIASGVPPERGLYTAIIGGFLVSLLGGSRFQIGGPAGAFIILMAATVTRHGIDGLLLATMMAGVLMVLMGLLRLGNYIKFIPYPVTVGFTAGIAVIILASQVKDLLGLSLAGREPSDILPKLEALGGALGTTNVAAVAVAAATIAIILGLRKYRPHWPGMLIAVAAGSVTAALLALPVETIGTRFGGIPTSLPWPTLPPLSLEKVLAVLPDAISFALLGAIESLLSAVVADGMTGRRHRSNMELVAQGIANIGAAVFGGVPATGTLARTATNVRSGAKGPVAGMLHSLFILLFMLVAAPLASFVPLAALAGVLAVVAWNMAERHEFFGLIRSSRGDAVVLLATFGLTVFRSLTEAIVVGFALGALLFINRMSRTTGVEAHVPAVPDDRADDGNGERQPYNPGTASDPDVVVCRISGAFFFGAAATIGTVLDGVADKPRALIIDFSAVPFVDSTAANAIAGSVRKAQRHGVSVFISGASPSIRRALLTRGVKRPAARYKPDVDAAVMAAHGG
jgi:sulfate permease, SulP family